MNYKLVIRPFALQEAADAYDWYELQREGLGEEFLSELNSFYAALLTNPFTFSYYQYPVRSGKINRFPYVATYEILDSEIVIFSIFMTYRDPTTRRIE